MRNSSNHLHGGYVLRKIVRLTIETNALTGMMLVIDPFWYTRLMSHLDSFCRHSWLCSIRRFSCEQPCLPNILYLKLLLEHECFYGPVSKILSNRESIDWRWPCYRSLCIGKLWVLSSASHFVLSWLFISRYSNTLLVVFNNRLFMTEIVHNREPNGSRLDKTSRPKHLMDTSHVAASPSNPDRFKIEISTDTVTDSGRGLEGYVSSSFSI